MEHHQQRTGPSLMLSRMPVRNGSPDENSIEECRNLIQFIAGKTEILYQECRRDHDKVKHIRSIGSTLATLTLLINRLECNPPVTSSPEIMEDARGFTYQSVRCCDLERICEK
jgi:hypothetical protein